MSLGMPWNGSGYSTLPSTPANAPGTSSIAIPKGIDKIGFGIVLTRDADRKWITFPSVSIRNSTSPIMTARDGSRWCVKTAIFRRRRVYRFETVTGSKLRLTIQATHGDPPARVFEIRAYHETATSVFEWAQRSID